MPNGLAHTYATVFLAAGSPFVLTPLLGGHASFAVSMGCLAGVLLTPDLDVNNGSISNHHARRMFGALPGLVWEVIWKPYSWIIPHRSPLSHMPVIGTAIRLMYLSCVIYLLLRLVGIFLPAIIPTVLPWWFTPAFLGLTLSDTAHFLMDLVFKGV